MKVRVWVTAPPDKGKANRAVVALVAAALGVPKSSVELARGETAREKLLRIAARPAGASGPAGR